MRTLSESWCHFLLGPHWNEADLLGVSTSFIQASWHPGKLNLPLPTVSYLLWNRASFSCSFKLDLRSKDLSNSKKEFLFYQTAGCRYVQDHTVEETWKFLLGSLCIFVYYKNQVILQDWRKMAVGGECGKGQDATVVRNGTKNWLEISKGMLGRANIRNSVEWQQWTPEWWGRR